MHAPLLHTALTNLGRADGEQRRLELLVGVEVGLCVPLLVPADIAPDAQQLGHLFDDVVFGDVHHVGRIPVELRLLDLFRPVGRAVAVSVLVRLACHRRDDEAVLGVRLVLALGVEVEEDTGVSVIDRLYPNALFVVLRVVLVLVAGPQPPGTKATADRFLEGVVVGFYRAAILFVRPEQHVASI